MKKKFLILLILFSMMYLHSEEKECKNNYFIELPKGTSIYAIDDGKLLSYGYDVYLGNYMVIDYYQIGIVVQYCNLGKIKNYYEKHITKANKIAESGDSGFIEEPGVTLIISLKDFFYDSKKLSTESY